MLSGTSQGVDEFFMADATSHQKLNMHTTEQRRVHSAHSADGVCLRLCLGLLIIGDWCGTNLCRGEEPIADERLSITSFQVDVTIPLGHRCMGLLPTKSLEILDPLECHGFVLLGAGDPIVLAAFDWCEIRNDAYDQWRDTLAQAAGTTRERVLVCALHQHDAPVIDSGAQDLLDQVGLHGELFDRRFHADCLAKVSAALIESLHSTRPLTHIGMGQALVSQVSSTRRVVLADGSITFGRGSASGGQPFFAEADEGEIDPFLRSMVFYSGEEPVVALHTYAVHPMSYYGRGEVSADFVGHARRLMQAAEPTCHHLYVSGCSGDVTAGKYNDGSPGMRPVLAERLYDGMRRSFRSVRREPIGQVVLRSVPLDLPFHEGSEFTHESLNAVLHDDSRDVRDRINAALGLASRMRVDSGRPIDFVGIDFGLARLVLFPGEAFVGYQHLAAEVNGDGFLLPIGYGECWPGYIPTDQALEEGFGDSWRWVGNGCEPLIREALQNLLTVKVVDQPARVWPLSRVVASPDATQAAAADGQWLYAISNTRVARYDRETGELSALSRGEALHLNSGFCWEGHLYCAHSNYPQSPEHSEIRVLDPQSMMLSTFHDFGESEGSLTWAIRDHGTWWCFFAFYGEENGQSYLARFDEEWRETSRWTLPQKLVDQLGQHSLSGGIWDGEELLVTGHDDPLVFRLKLPMAGYELELIARDAVPFTGQGIAMDPLTGGLVGIDRSRREIRLATRPE